MKSFKASRNIIFVFLLIFVNSSSFASDDHESGGHESEKRAVTIDENVAEISRIKTNKASSGSISEQLKVYGKTVNDPSQINHIRARFTGTIVSVNVQIGDQVGVGDTLAFVESNESLKKYPIKALMSGVVVARHANPGEIASDQVLFTLANFERIWAEFQVFPGQLNLVKAKQKVRISGSEGTVDSIIEHIIPSQDESPYSIARVLINNESHDWTTGLLVSGQVVINEFESTIVIEQKAIQIIENKPFVFVKEGNSYEAHQVMPGRSDGDFTEILSGLRLGDDYVVENSYLIKADIEKSGASHDH